MGLWCEDWYAKCKFSASDIFTGASCEELCPSTHSIDVPVVNKKDWMIQGLQDETYIQSMLYNQP